MPPARRTRTRTAPSATPPEPPATPQIEHAPTNADEVAALAGLMADFRKEVAAYRKEVAEFRKQQGPQRVTVVDETPEDREQKRLVAIANATHYCPGCGRLSTYPRECTGLQNGQHAPIEAVPTDELSGDPAEHTAAPNTDELGQNAQLAA